VRMFLGAFGIECCQVSMESDCDDEALRNAVWAGEKGCGEWTPTPPSGDGWMLSDIFDTEDGPYALFIRRKPPEPKKSRRERYAAPAPSASPTADQLAAAHAAGRTQGLEEAAAAVEQHDRAGREWIPGSLWGQLSSEAASRIRALLAASPANQVEETAAYPSEMPPALRQVLSLMLWHTGPVAHVLRAGGADIKTRAEDEQAHVLHWLIQLALEHGDAWRDRASERVSEIRAAISASKESEKRE